MFKVRRSLPAPLSLAAGRSYSEPDVVKSLSQDFFDKCYICETKDPISLNIEHFIAHQDDRELMYDWENLFLCCARCNNFKRHYYNNLLNCTDPELDIWRMIEHIPPTSPGGTVRIAPTFDDERTRSTAKLIFRVFNEDNTGNKQVTSTYLKKKLFSEYAELVKHMNTFIDPRSLEDEKQDAVKRIRHMMTESQEYSAFMRWAVVDDPLIYELVADMLPLPGPVTP
ncbi:HNH endonuclease [Pseudomonas viridiflava]|uniref:HNH endonuclease n=1 Tax=Pseudomonas viridiflava TaxID=33069 RepID=UPI002EAB39BF|nr:HNH endonuclease [Pseudomonas viridiflava]